jgi:glutamyl-Q tRNA(Asp) synthetase
MIEGIMSAILRFAPSPNGRLHLGHAFSALFTWRAAATLGGSALLRIEDIDLARSKPEFNAGIRQDLHWLGLAWPEPVMRQSKRMDAYRAAAAQLGDLLYPCDCTRAELAARTDGRADPDGTPLYDGKCRRHGLAGGRPIQLRLDMDRAISRAGAPTIRSLPVDGVDLDPAHPKSRPAEPARWGDAVLVRKDTPTSYHLSVVVDDAAQAVTHVTRGQDLEPATDLHVLLQSLLGLLSPIYAHHGLIRDETRMKLSKSRDSLSLKDLREMGWTPEAVRTQLGFDP